MAVHEFVPSGDYLVIGRLGKKAERCDQCGLIQQGPGTIHDTSGLTEEILEKLKE